MNYNDLSGMDLPWEKLKGKNILVAGANGMIASALVESLLACDSKHGLSMKIYAMCRSKEKAERRFASYLGKDALHFLFQDVAEEFPKDLVINYIIHAASSAYPEAMNSVPADIMKANLFGTVNLLDYCRLNKKTRFLYVSSSEVYGENFEGVDMFRENMSGSLNFARFRACYPESKRASETLTLSYIKQYGVDAVIVRPAFVYGKDINLDNTRADVYFLRQVLNNENIVMHSEGTQIRSYCYVKDCVSAMIYVLLKGECGEIYNIGDEECVVTLRQYAEKLAEIGGVKVITDMGTRPKDTVLLKTTRMVLDTTKLRNLGWFPKYDLETGIHDLLAE